MNTRNITNKLYTEWARIGTIIFLVHARTKNFVCWAKYKEKDDKVNKNDHLKNYIFLTSVIIPTIPGKYLSTQKARYA